MEIVEYFQSVSYLFVPVKHSPTEITYVCSDLETNGMTKPVKRNKTFLALQHFGTLARSNNNPPARWYSGLALPNIVG